MSTTEQDIQAAIAFWNNYPGKVEIIHPHASAVWSFRIHGYEGIDWSHTEHGETPNEAIMNAYEYMKDKVEVNEESTTTYGQYSGYTNVFRKMVDKALDERDKEQ